MKKAYRERASVVCLYQDKLLVFKGVDPSSKQVYWFLPGGKIEAGEKPWACARREALEETSYRLIIDPNSEVVKSYSHHWDQVQYSCKTFFYRGILAEEYHDPKPVSDADYHHGTFWIPLKSAIEFFAYTKEIQQAVIALAM